MAKLRMFNPMQGVQLKTGPRIQKAGDDRIRGRALQRIRDRILTRDGGRCQCERCSAPGAVIRRADVVDHIVPLWAGGSEDDSNRQSLNAECHELKSKAETRQRTSGWGAG